MKQRTFRPENSGKIDGKQTFTKGTKVYEVSEEQLRIILRKLRPSAEVPILALTGESKENYDLIVEFVSHFYSSGNYAQLHKIITEEFSDLGKLSPGTVGAYMLGSIATDDNCHPLSVSSAPSSSPSYKPCTERVLLATHCEGEYDFTPLNIVDSCNVVIYLPEKNFTGFSAKEKEKLKDLGVEFVDLRAYDGNKTVNIRQGILEMLQTREGNLPEVSSPQTQSYSLGNIAFFVLIIVIILILFFVAWKAYYP